MNDKIKTLVAFKRSGKCPICRRMFFSRGCKHTEQYVRDVMAEVFQTESQFMRDVRKATENLLAANPSTSVNVTVL